MEGWKILLAITKLRDVLQVQVGLIIDWEIGRDSMERNLANPLRICCSERGKAEC